MILLNNSHLTDGLNIYKDHSNELFLDLVNEYYPIGLTGIITNIQDDLITVQFVNGNFLTDYINRFQKYYT